jgi:regulator of RNase E activity RraA
VTVSIGGMTVNPGDIIIGDEDGIIAVPADSAESILILAEAQHLKEEAMFKAIEERSADRGWVNETLRVKGCEFS